MSAHESASSPAPRRRKASGGGPPDVIWTAEPHTLAKHQILRKYLNAWVPILAQSPSGSPRVVLIDGFAGPGEYAGGQDGSPIIAIKSVIEHAAFARLKGQFVFLFVEAGLERCDHLDQVAIPALGPLPKNIQYQVVHGTFDAAMMEVLDGLDAKGHHMAPSFALIDPFGFSDTPMAVLGRLLAHPRSEVLVTVMLENVNRFLSSPSDKVLQHFDDLFGTDQWRSLLSVENRFNQLGDLYKQQLLANGAKYVWSFRMVDSGNRPIYDLFFATKHIEGLRQMKRAMWNVDPGGGYRFSDRATEQGMLMLFSPSPDMDELRKALVAEFSGKTMTYLQLEAWVLTNTIFHDGHIKKACLKLLEQEGEIEYLPPVHGFSLPARRKGTFANPLCRIRFL